MLKDLVFLLLHLKLYGLCGVQTLPVHDRCLGIQLEYMSLFSTLFTSCGLETTHNMQRRSIREYSGSVSWEENYPEQKRIWGVKKSPVRVSHLPNMSLPLFAGSPGRSDRWKRQENHTLPSGHFFFFLSFFLVVHCLFVHLWKLSW